MKLPYPIEHYSKSQLHFISIGQGPNPLYGDVSELDPQRWNSYSIHWVSLGRGSDPRYGDVSDLDPNLCDYRQMSLAALRRGCLDHLVRYPNI